MAKSRSELLALLDFVRHALESGKPYKLIELQIRFETPVDLGQWLDFFAAKAPTPDPHPELPIDMYYTYARPWRGVGVTLSSTVPNGWTPPVDEPDADALQLVDDLAALASGLDSETTSSVTE